MILVTHVGLSYNPNNVQLIFLFFVLYLGMMDTAAGPVMDVGFHSTTSGKQFVSVIT